jgi:hypothetical protein
VREDGLDLGGRRCLDERVENDDVLCLVITGIRVFRSHEERRCLPKEDRRSRR